ncbi:Fic family protein [Acetobacter orientalis]|uniref:Fic family protein n=1 Tax=Acetobacter orientalis TaxID=146474 RepID=UPI00214D6C6A|nr:Fic family protein [Acetobacter orientalis]
MSEPVRSPRLGRFVETPAAGETVRAFVPPPLPPDPAIDVLALRLIREMHARLLQSGRGGTKSPGEFRRTQNWIGGTRPGNALFVPPPPTEMDGCLDALELFMHENSSRLPALIKAGLLHVQFETIHPFLDGNGRIGRLLVTLYLCVNGVLRTPLLYLSLYLKTHRAVNCPGFTGE